MKAVGRVLFTMMLTFPVISSAADTALVTRLQSAAARSSTWVASTEAYHSERKIVNHLLSEALKAQGNPARLSEKIEEVKFRVSEMIDLSPEKMNFVVQEMIAGFASAPDTDYFNPIAILLKSKMNGEPVLAASDSEAFKQVEERFDLYPSQAPTIENASVASFLKICTVMLVNSRSIWYATSGAINEGKSVLSEVEKRGETDAELRSLLHASSSN